MATTYMKAIITNQPIDEEYGDVHSNSSIKSFQYCFSFHLNEQTDSKQLIYWGPNRTDNGLWEDEVFH